MDEHCKMHLLGVSLGIVVSWSFGKYLETFVDFARDESMICNDVFNKIAKKTLGWNAKLLSQAGGLILCKNVLQTIPIYHFSISLFQQK